jgi:hypothetical protein
MLKVIAPFLRRLAPSLAGAFVLSIVSGCTTTSAPPANVHLSGQWHLDQAASDDPDAKVAAAVNQAESKLRKRLASAGYGEYGTDAPAPGSGGRRSRGSNGSGSSGGAALNGDEFSQTGFIAPDFADLHRRLRQVLDAPQLLTIDVQPDFVRLTGDDVPAREYPADDEFTRIDEYGTARIDTKWSGTTFELRARYSHASVTELYAADVQGSTLTVTRKLSDPDAGKISVHSVYRK